VILRRKLKVQIVNEIVRVVQSILDDGPYEETSTALPVQLNEHETSTPPQNPSNCLLNFLFPLKTFHLLQHKGVLPESVQGKQVKYELDSNRLLVQIMPSPAHDAAANAWNTRIAIWSTNGGAGPETLRHCGGGRTSRVVENTDV
jgi:hypothetical protein